MTQLHRAASGMAAPEAVDAVRLATVLLFVPGDRPDRFDKAAGAGSDLPILDLEDGVAPAAKAAARAHVAGWAGGHRCVVRVNPPGTPWFDADLAALAGASGVAAVMIPKCGSEEDVAQAREGLGSRGPGTGEPPRILPLVETAGGVLAAARIAAAPGVVRLAFGNLDLAAECGITPTQPDEPELRQARSLLVLASAAAGLPGPLDGVLPEVDAPDRLTARARCVAALGFTGMLAIHPRQLAPIRAGLRPDPDQVAWARAVLGAAAPDENDLGVMLVDGGMVDRPVVERARAVLRRADLTGSRPTP